LPFNNQEKQLFLEAKDVNERAKTLYKVLGMAEASSRYVQNSTSLH
jgi:Lon protease-like protein